MTIHAATAPAGVTRHAARCPTRTASPASLHSPPPRTKGEPHSIQLRKSCFAQPRSASGTATLPTSSYRDPIGHINWPHEARPCLRLRPHGSFPARPCPVRHTRPHGSARQPRPTPGRHPRQGLQSPRPPARSPSHPTAPPLPTLCASEKVPRLHLVAAQSPDPAKEKLITLQTAPPPAQTPRPSGRPTRKPSPSPLLHLQRRKARSGTDLPLLPHYRPKPASSPIFRAFFSRSPLHPRARSSPSFSLKTPPAPPARSPP